MCVCVCVCVCERERERERARLQSGTREFVLLGTFEWVIVKDHVYRTPVIYKKKMLYTLYNRDMLVRGGTEGAKHLTERERERERESNLPLNSVRVDTYYIPYR